MSDPTTLEEALERIEEMDSTIQDLNFELDGKPDRDTILDEIRNDIVDTYCVRCEKTFRTHPLLDIKYCSKDCENGNYKRP